MSLTNKLVHTLRFEDSLTRKSLTGAGGAAIVCANGLLSRASLFDPDNGFASLSQPVTFDGGEIKFAVENTIDSVDIYGITPGGYAFVLKDVKAQELIQVPIVTANRHHTLVIPFDHADFAAATETDTGFDEPANSLWLPTPFVNVVDVDATETIDVGTDGSGSNDPDGFIDGLSVATAGVIKPTLTNGAKTLGALLQVQSGGTAGDDVPEGSAGTGDSITITPSAGSDTFSGTVHLPYMLAA